jgi:hypothetical protein
MSGRFTLAEQAAIKVAKQARDELIVAIAAYETAGFGAQVTDPLRDALDNVSHSLSEVQS